MASIYEINAQIQECLNPETGEFDEERFNGLIELKETKIEQVICFYKNVVAMAKAMKEEEKSLKERREAEERKAENLRNYIQYALDGEKFKTSKVSVSYRKTQSVEVADNFVSWAIATGHDTLLKYKEPEVSKTAVKEAILAGEKDIPAQIIEGMSMTIK